MRMKIRICFVILVNTESESSKRRGPIRLMMVPNSFLIFHLVLNGGLALRISPPRWFLVQSTILMHLKPLAPTEFQPLSLRCVLQSFPVLAKLYNKCLAESCFPSCWKSSAVVPVFESNGERSDPSNYRSIRLLPIISKIFESFISDNLTKHLDITCVFSDLQRGFRAFLSTADILTVLSERSYNSLDTGGNTTAIALDISKAFDKAWHAVLLHKLKTYGGVGPIQSVLESSS